MSIELKQAAQDAAEAIDWLLKNIQLDAPHLSGKAMGNAEKCASALRTAIQQAESEPVYWEWRHQGSHPDAVDFGQWSEWKRVEPRSALHTVEDALNEFRGYIARGLKYELLALYTHPAPGVPDDVVRDAERYRWLLRNYLRFNLQDEAWKHGSIDAAIDAAMLAAAPATTQPKEPS